MYPKKPTNPSYLSAFFKVFPKTLAAFFLICLIFPTALLAENKNPISAGNFIEPKSEMRFDLPKKDAKEQCAFVRDLYKKGSKKTNKKFIVNNLYMPIGLFELNDEYSNIEKNEIIVMDGNHQPYGCFFYYNNNKIIGADCVSSGYDEDAPELDDLLSKSLVIRYKDDCFGLHHNENSVNTKIQTNCFVNSEKSQLKTNDIIIKNCSAEFYQ